MKLVLGLFLLSLPVVQGLLALMLLAGVIRALFSAFHVVRSLLASRAPLGTS